MQIHQSTKYENKNVRCGAGRSYDDKEDRRASQGSRPDHNQNDHRVETVRRPSRHRCTHRTTHGRRRSRASQHTRPEATRLRQLEDPRGTQSDGRSGQRTARSRVRKGTRQRKRVSTASSR